MERVTKWGARCKATIPGNHPGKTVSTLWSLSMSLTATPCSRELQESGRLDTRADARNLAWVQVQMFSDSAQVADVIVGKFANVADVSPEVIILIKHNTMDF